MTTDIDHNISDADSRVLAMPSQPNLAPEDRFRRTVEETLSLHDQLLLFAACRATISAGTKTVQPYQVLGEYLLITRGARIPSLQDILSHLPVLETEGYLSVSSRTGRIKVSQGDLSVSKMVDALSEIDIPRVFAEQTGSLGSPREI